MALALASKFPKFWRAPEAARPARYYGSVTGHRLELAPGPRWPLVWAIWWQKKAGDRVIPGSRLARRGTGRRRWTSARGYAGINSRPQLLQCTDSRPSRTRCRCWVGRDIRQA